MTSKELKEILENHSEWLQDAEKGERANLRGANLQYAYLRGANLQYAYLRGANLQYAYLRGANLQYAYLRGANLRGANLQGADLQDTNLQDADLRGADLRDADLRNSTHEFPVCPIVGSFIGFKKCRYGKIVKLLILKDAKRSSATTRKCRASKVKVLEIYSYGNSQEKYETAISMHGEDFIYEVGERIEIPDFDENRWNECSTGIHFFLTEEEARRY